MSGAIRGNPHLAGRKPNEASRALTREIMRLRTSGLSWAQIGIRVGLNRQAVRGRYIRGMKWITS